MKFDKLTEAYMNGVKENGGENVTPKKPDPRNENTSSTDAYYAVKNNLWTLEEFEDYLIELEQYVKYGGC